MNKKVLWGFMIFTILIITLSLLIKKDQKPLQVTSSPNPTTGSSISILTSSDGFALYAQGECSNSSDCAPAGCSNHVCSNDPGIITTCEVPTVDVKSQGYSCGCVNSNCVWYK